MPKVNTNLKVEVSEATAEDVRLINVAISASAAEFLLADLLRQRGAVGGVEALLKPAVKEALQKYLEGVEDLIAGVKKAGLNGKAKPKTASAEAASQAEPNHEPEEGRAAHAAAY